MIDLSSKGAALLLHTEAGWIPHTVRLGHKPAQRLREKAMSTLNYGATSPGPQTNQERGLEATLPEGLRDTTALITP